MGLPKEELTSNSTILCELTEQQYEIGKKYLGRISIRGERTPEEQRYVLSREMGGGVVIANNAFRTFELSDEIDIKVVQGIRDVTKRLTI
jgi:hypothetical protein